MTARVWSHTQVVILARHFQTLVIPGLIAREFKRNRLAANSGSTCPMAGLPSYTKEPRPDCGKDLAVRWRSRKNGMDWNEWKTGV